MVDHDESASSEERAFIEMVEAADPDELAELLSRPTREEEEEILITYFGEDRYHRMHERALRRNLRRTAQAPIGNVVGPADHARDA
jgi:hypothetical protein